jgi:hypothetical protein
MRVSVLTTKIFPLLKLSQGWATITSSVAKTPNTPAKRRGFKGFKVRGFKVRGFKVKGFNGSPGYLITTSRNGCGG